MQTEGSNIYMSGAEATRITEPKRDKRMSFILDYSGSIPKSTVTFCREQLCQSQTKTPLMRLYRVSRDPFVSSRLPVIWSLSALYMLMDGAKRDRSSLAELELWVLAACPSKQIGHISQSCKYLVAICSLAITDCAANCPPGDNRLHALLNVYWLYFGKVVKKQWIRMWIIWMSFRSEKEKVNLALAWQLMR